MHRVPSTSSFSAVMIGSTVRDGQCSKSILCCFGEKTGTSSSPIHPYSFMIGIDSICITVDTFVFNSLLAICTLTDDHKLRDTHAILANFKNT